MKVSAREFSFLTMWSHHSAFAIAATPIRIWCVFPVVLSEKGSVHRGFPWADSKIFCVLVSLSIPANWLGSPFLQSLVDTAR